MTSTIDTATGNAAATAAAVAATTVLPSAEPLAAGVPERGTTESALTFAGAALAELDGIAGGALAVLVGPDLVEALSASPLGDLDLSAAVQPALDAAAAALGTTARSARVIDVMLVENDLGGPFTVVPLNSAGSTDAALLVTDVSLPQASAGQAFPPIPKAAPSATATGSAAGHPRGIEMLHGVVMDVTVELGRTRMTVRELLALTPGTVLELDRAAGSPADLLVNGRRIARGEVVVVDEDFGLRVTEIVNDSAAS
jgi:flagellar motor switch protein FliN/FliY